MTKKMVLDALQVVMGTLLSAYLAYCGLAWAAAVVGWVSGGLAVFLLHSWTTPVQDTQDRF